jgi:hypothetical protein
VAEGIPMTDFYVHEYAYRPKGSMVLFGTLFFGAAAIFFEVMAHSNDRGLVINGIIKLSPLGATVFYWVLAVCSLGFVLMSIAIFIHLTFYSQKIVLTLEALIVPKSRWSFENITISYSSIIEIRITQVRSQRFMKITHQAGKSTITASMLPLKNDFDNIYQLLLERIEISRSNF